MVHLRGLDRLTVTKGEREGIMGEGKRMKGLQEQL